MGKEITEYSSRTKRQRKNGSQEIGATEKRERQQESFEFYGCDGKMRQPSKRENTPQQMEKVVQQREQKSTREVSKKRTRSIKAADLFKLLEKQEYICSLSGVELTPENVSCDHIVALEKGGKHDIANLQLVHRTVNRMKTTMLQDEFLDWCRLISKHNGS